MGRQSTYTPEKAATILEGLKTGKSLRAVAKEVGISHGAILDWTRDIDGFGDQYARAREQGYQLLADELVEIADEECVVVKHPQDEDKEVEVAFDSAGVARNRLRVDTRKWMLSKMLPKVYGDRLDLNHSGSIDLANAVLSARKRAKPE